MPTLDLLEVPSLTTTPQLATQLTALIEAAPLPGLADQPRCSETAARIVGLRQAAEFRGGLIEAGLWLLAGELDKSHAISQASDSPAGSFWHGIMHRREGDFGNAKYWFRRVGKHSVLTSLAAHIDAHRSQLSDQLPLAQLAQADSLADALVDEVQKAVESGDASTTNDLQRIGWC